MAPMPRVNPRDRKRACRVFRTLTLSPRSEAFLEAMSARTGIARGRIVDLALANVSLCDACRGRGTVDDPELGRDARECSECRGAMFVPGVST